MDRRPVSSAALADRKQWEKGLKLRQHIPLTRHIEDGSVDADRMTSGDDSIGGQDFRFTIL